MPPYCQKNIEWNITAPSPEDGYSLDKITVLLLIDIRDEMRKLNRTLACPEFRSIPRVLRAIRQHTGRIKPRPKRLVVSR
jgi:hypothetical protein